MGSVVVIPLPAVILNGNTLCRWRDTVMKKIPFYAIPSVVYGCKQSCLGFAVVLFLLTTAFNQQSTASDLHYFNKPPRAKTSPASDVTNNSATLTGIANANGLSTTVWFQYRIVNGPSQNTFSTQTVIGTSDTGVSIGIIQLLPGMTYYYRLVARNDAGIVYGEELSFTTTDIQASVTTDISPPAGSVSINKGAYYTNSSVVTVTLSATDNIGVSGYYLSAAAIPPSSYAAGWMSVTPPAKNYREDVAYTPDNGDGENTVYVWYKDASGNISDGARDSIIVDTTPPALTISDPTSDPLYMTTSKTISISGSASDDVNEIKSIVWSSDTARGEKDRKTVGWTISNIELLEGDNVITVKAMDSVGNMGIATITVTYAAGNYPPAVITGTAMNITTDLVTLTGTVNAKGLPSAVWFQYGTSSDFYSDTSSQKGIGSGLGDIQVSDRINGLLAETRYYYRLAAQNSAGITYGNELTFSTMPPKGRIYGEVVCSAGGKPVGSARLCFKGTGAKRKAFRVLSSDENGFFACTDLGADAYLISATKAGFKGIRRTLELKEGEEKKIEIPLEEIKGEDQKGDKKSNE